MGAKYHIELNRIYNEDCLEGMKRIADKSIDMILCDLPYGTTACKWDTAIPVEPLWEQYNRIIKDNGAIVLFADEPFTSQLVNSNLKQFRYKWIWNKTRGSNFQNARFMPMKCHEEICVFYKKKPTYNPQFWFSTPYKTAERKRTNQIEGLSGGSAANVCTATISEDGRRYPLSILTFVRDGSRIHPTQKPVALFEYLIKTYTNEGETVLDNCIGSGTTAIACINTGRNYIGFELDAHYCEIANERIQKALAEKAVGE
jgi:site-specific DNA-methyltransferase (adenine-specific)